eukprot:gene3883-4138_t
MTTSADLPVGKLIKALLAISFGTIIEWYDFTIYTQLASVISKVFFPGSDPGVQALSVWGIFAVGFISRPVGALLFGHMGDTRGRGLCLLLSVILMGVPTGLAMGGEFGAAMVYLHEIALPEYKAVTGSLGYVSLGIGVVLGILVVAAVINLIPSSAMLVWGWRVPFLLAVITLVAAIVLRYNMPESQEFLVSRDEIDHDYQRRLKQQQMPKNGASTNKGPVASMATDTDLACDLAGSEASGSMVKASVVSAAGAAGSKGLRDLEAGGTAAEPTKHYVPFVELFRGHWKGIILQSGYEAWIGAAFYLGYSWLPSFFTKHVGIPQSLTLWMVLSCMIIFTFFVPLAGWLSDKGQGRITATIVVSLVAGATSVPMFLAFATKKLVACWLLQAATLSAVGYTMGILPAICSSIYPAGVRISGFNFAYNFGIMSFGGLVSVTE